MHAPLNIWQSLKCEPFLNNNNNNNIKRKTISSFFRVPFWDESFYDVRVWDIDN
jgi:hypothetical protein